jgi:hypothetical protein
MGIEEQFRATKGHRFGLKLRWTKFTKAEFVERMYLLVAHIGCYYWQKLTKQVKLTIRSVREHLPPPRLSLFKWLTAPQN